MTIQGDGDLMYSPGVLWTCAHSRLPIFYVVHNNRGYHQEKMVLQRMANRRQRVASLRNDIGPVGTRLENPTIDYGKLASSMGMWSAGPIPTQVNSRQRSKRRCRWSRLASLRWSMS